MAEFVVERRFAAHRERMVRHGAVAGFVGGVLMTLLLMVVAVIQGGSFWRPAELFGSIWYAALHTGSGVIVLGIITNLVLLVGFGLLYSYLISYVRIEPVVSGLLYGAVMFAFIGVLVLSAAFPPVYAAFTVWALFVSYLLYGLTLGLFEDWADRRWVRL